MVAWWCKGLAFASTWVVAMSCAVLWSWQCSYLVWCFVLRIVTVPCCCCSCFILMSMPKLCTVISTLRWGVLTVLWIRFCLTQAILLCVDSCVYVFFALYCLTVYVLYYCNMVGWTWWDWSLILEHLPSVLGHCWLGHSIRKNLSPIWPIMCSVGR